MKFFLEYLTHFSANDILRMYGEGAFRTSEEIKLADFVINFKVIFHDNYISSEELKKYNHLQLVVDAIRAHQLRNGTMSHLQCEEFGRLCSSEDIHFSNFIVHSESEREARRVNMLERTITFCFKAIQQDVDVFLWLENALKELLSYVLRDSEEEDRVGVVIRYEHCQKLNAAFPIKLKNELKTCIVVDTVTSLIRTRGSLITGQRMVLQLVRIRLPMFYRKLTPEDVLKGIPVTDDICLP